MTFFESVIGSLLSLATFFGVSTHSWGLIVAGIVVGLICLAASLIKAQTLLVVTEGGSYKPPGSESERRVNKGDVIPPDHADSTKGTVQTQEKALKLLRGLIVGADNRLSTSKAVAVVWTLAIFYGLLALLLARAFGDSAGWDALTKHGLQEEYLLLLGGPYAAAVIAKYQASGDETKTSAAPGSAKPQDLIASDSGQADLGDFQYVLFNLLALAWYLGELISHLGKGMPQIPELLTGLALTSAGAYSAKKLVGQATPTLTSVVPTEVVRNADKSIPAIQVWGTNLVIPSAAGTNELNPTVVADKRAAKVDSIERTLGSDRLSVILDTVVSDGQPLLVSVVRADGLPVSGPGGAGGLTVTVRPAPPTNPASATQPAGKTAATPPAGQTGTTQ